MEELIDDVMRSTNREPSVPAVVLDTMQAIIEEEEENMVSEDDRVVDEDERAKISDIKAEMEEIKRQSSVSAIISNFEAKTEEENERQSVSPQVSPRRSISPEEVFKDRIKSSEERSIKEEDSLEERSDESAERNEDLVTVKSVSAKTDDVVTVSTKQKETDKSDSVSDAKKREMEIQAVKVKIDDNDDNNEPIMSTNIDDVITINGQPVPAASTVLVNGHVTVIQNTPQRDNIDKSRSPDRDKGRSPDRQLVNEQNNVRKDSKGFIQQTDLDTFETKLTNNVEPSESNLDDDSSDQKSDTGSVNTVDSLDKEEKPVESRPEKNRRLKNRNVSIEIDP